MKDSFGNVNDVHIYRCWAPSSETLAQREKMLDRFMLNTSDHNSKIITADFNAWALDWGSQVTKTMSKILLKSFPVFKEGG